MPRGPTAQNERSVRLLLTHTKSCNPAALLHLIDVSESLAPAALAKRWTVRAKKWVQDRR
jgi:hypothetical protein